MGTKRRFLRRLFALRKQDQGLPLPSINSAKDDGCRNVIESLLETRNTAIIPGTLEHLPTELLLLITDYLPPASRASLGLASKTMLLRQGPDVVFGLQREDTHELLKTFEEGGMFPEQFLCSGCRRFHRPRLPEYWLSLGKNRDCSPLDHGSKRECDATALRARHCAISRSMVVAILRSHRLGNAIYPLHMLKTDIVYRLPFKQPGRITRSAEARIRFGHLIVKTEWAYASGRPTGDAEKVTAILRKMPAKWAPGLSSMCPHMSWEIQFGALLLRPPVPNFVGLRYSCIWEHPVSCAGETCGWAGGAGVVNGCSRCFTDFRLSKRDDPSAGGGEPHRTMVLTTWQHYGRGDDSCWGACHDGVAIRRGPYRAGLVKQMYESDQGQSDAAVLDFLAEEGGG